MTFWIVALLVGAALSPLAWLRPSRRQSRQMELRLEARRMGLAMQLSREEWPHWLLSEPPSPCAQYHRSRRAGHQDSWCYWQLEPGQWLNRWREPCEDARLLTQLQTLPADVFKVEASPQMIALCWGEKPEPQALARIAAALLALA
ncbi:MAG: hypothetical protein K2X58_11935 [Pseudomonadaceae bacterium]|nr:hypothetical protein [Pseudomonadaceae bacterium]